MSIFIHFYNISNSKITSYREQNLYYLKCGPCVTVINIRNEIGRVQILGDTVYVSLHLGKAQVH